MPVGRHEWDHQNFTKQEVTFQKGDTLYLISNGYADQFGGPESHRGGKKFMSKKLKQLLASIAKYDMFKQNEILTTEFENWKGKLEQVDDVTIIGIRL
jgi:serine phosphatase RsbU (regulator of sigma subunit)